jgi:hypothetical protein
LLTLSSVITRFEGTLAFVVSTRFHISDPINKTTVATKANIVITQDTRKSHDSGWKDSVVLRVTSALMVKNKVGAKPLNNWKKIFSPVLFFSFDTKW